MMNFNELPEFSKDYKKLFKKFKSLDKDLVDFEKVLSAALLGIGKHFNVITQTDILYIVKARLFSRYLKKSSLRVIYAHFKQEQKIEFIEVYFKGNKKNENRERIKNYLKDKI